MRTKLIAVVILLCGLSAATERQKAAYKVTRLTTTQVAISCLNGANPAGHAIGDMVIMSCTNQ